MHQFIARESIDHYLGLLQNGALHDDSRAMVHKLLVGEEDKLAHDLEHLGFAEDRAQRGRLQVSNIRSICDGAADGESRARGARVLATVEETQRLLDAFCDRLRHRISSRSL